MTKALSGDEVVTTVIQQGADLKSLSHRFLTLEDNLMAVNAKLDDMIQSIHSIMSRPTFNLHSTLSIVKDTAILVAAAVAAIIWVAKSHYDAQLSLLTERQEATKQELVVHSARLDRVTTDNWNATRQTNWCLVNKAAYPNLVCN